MAAKYAGNLDGSPTNGATRRFKVASGVTITDGDFVYFDGSGRITNASIGGQLLVGVANVGAAGDTVTGNAGGTVTALVVVERGALWLIDGDEVGTSLAATHVGTKFDLTGATGAQLVDTSTTGATGQLILVENNPQIDPVKGDTSYGLYMIAESVWSAGTGAQ